MNPRFLSWDKMFSYWVLVWFFVYFISCFLQNENPFFGFIYENTNPVFMFILALLSSIKNTTLIIMYNPLGYKQLITHICKFLVIKIIPLYFLLQQKIKVPENILFSLVYLNIYFIYLFYLNENVFDIYNELEKQIINNNCNTSLEYFINYMYKNITKIIK